ncbi:MAG: hypothetical protein U0074_00055 [Kouleothrix sp.]
MKALLAFADDALQRKPIDVPEIININSDIDSPVHFNRRKVTCMPGIGVQILLRDTDPAQAAAYAQQARDWIMAMPRNQTQVKDYDHNTRLNLSVYMQNLCMLPTAGRLDACWWA